MATIKSILLTVLFVLAPTTAKAIPKDVYDLMVAYGLNIDRFVDSISINNRDVSIEVETTLYDHVLKILTTTDGTIRPLFHTPTQSVTKWFLMPS